MRALSRASALGLWQFIASTGLRYGLGRDSWVDERLDPEKSTDAAIAYLVDLHGMFGDWPKALAAYNCGEARVLRLSRPQDGEYKDFWDLYEQLPGETRRYVPRLIAALLIIENPAKYGMVLPEPAAPPAGLAGCASSARCASTGSTRRSASRAGRSRRSTRSCGARRRRRSAYELRVPAGREDALAAQIATLPEWTPPAPEYRTHRVRSGETLSLIASRYGTSVSAVMRANGLRSANRLRVGQRLRIPVRGAQATR